MHWYLQCTVALTLAYIVLSLARLGRARASWYWKETRGTSLAVQWLRLHTSTLGARVQFLVGELRSCMLHGPKKRKERERETRLENVDPQQGKDNSEWVSRRQARYPELKRWRTEQGVREIPHLNKMSLGGRYTGGETLKGQSYFAPQGDCVLRGSAKNLSFLNKMMGYQEGLELPGNIQDTQLNLNFR